MKWIVLILAEFFLAILPIGLAIGEKLELSHKINRRLLFLKWNLLSAFLNQSIVKATVFIPVVGYLILFNQQIHPYWKLIFADHHEPWRVYYLYIGLTTIAVSSLLFRAVCPSEIKEHETHYNFIDRELDSVRDSTLENYRLLYLRAIASDYTDKDFETVITLLNKGHLPNQLPECTAAQEKLYQILHSTKLGRHINSIGDQNKLTYFRTIMREYFMVLTLMHPVFRIYTFCVLCLGISIVSIPTIHVAGLVFKTFFSQQ